MIEWEEAHYSIITKLRDIVRESTVVETHPDFKKGADGSHSPKNGINSNVTIEVAYGAVRYKNEPMRVKLTLKSSTTSIPATRRMPIMLPK